MKIILKLSSLSILIIVLLSGCNLFTDPVSPADRLSLFETDLNSDSRDTIHENIHSDAAIFNQIKAATWWDSTYFSSAYDNFTFTNIAVSPESAGIISATATISNSSATYSTLITFKEGSEEDVWFILSLTLWTLHYALQI